MEFLVIELSATVAVLLGYVSNVFWDDLEHDAWKRERPPVE
jgi:hypothetical protein